MDIYDRHEWFAPKNKTAGVCLWTCLDLLLPYACGGVDNQHQSPSFDQDAPQHIDMMWDDFHDHTKRDPLLPLNFYSHQVRVKVECKKQPLDHECIYMWTQGNTRSDMLTTTHYKVPSIRHLKKLVSYLADGRTDVLTLLEEVDCDEWILSAAQKELGMPRPIEWPTPSDN